MARTPSPKSLLATYRAKRDFTKTREPSGVEKASKAGHVYMIQKHDATRLHYDFRLELDGVLKSWAVTRGPSLNPADKRLAVQTEDHPLAYATFEGTIPEGEYGGGTVMLWDRGSWEPLGDAQASLKKGHLRFLLHGERLQGEWHLVRMHGHRKGDAKRQNWLLIKAEDEFANANGDAALTRHTTSVATDQDMPTIAAEGPIYGRTKKAAAKPRRTPKSRTLPDFVEPQLATLVDAPPNGKQWIHEIKFDGYRLLARIENGHAILRTRTGLDWTQKFRPIADALAKMKVDALIDGEVVAMEEDGSMSFAALQQALKADDASKLHFFAFDLLQLNGEDLTTLPLRDRKARLRPLIPARQTRLRYSEDFDQAGTEVLAHACQIDLEGIISKRADAPYRSGRGEDWLKSKCLHEQEFVIAGYTEQTEHPGMLGALLIGYFEDGDLHYAGKVGTGFTNEEARELLARFKKLTRAKSLFAKLPTAAKRQAHWLTPTLVAQIRFTEWTRDGMLRHPAYLGLREDKPAADVVREQARKVSAVAETKSTKTKRASTRRTQAVTLEGIALTHPEKLLFAEEGISKADLATYYAAMAPYILPHIAGRPISILRCPDGVGTDGKACFFQRHAGVGAPAVLHRVTLEKGEEPFLMVDDAAGLVALAQIGALEIHVWGSSARRPQKPDRLTFDFDPDPSVPFTAVKQAAKDMRAMLSKLGLESFLKTTGGKGLHVVVPFTPGPSWKQARDFSEALAQLLSDANPGHYTLNNRKAERKGRIFIDYLRNDYSASAIAPYSPRARPGAPVALPISWNQLGQLRSGALHTIATIPAALKKRREDPWAGLMAVSQSLPAL